MKHVLSLGAGVQSSTIALMAAHGELPAPEFCVFADTQVEPPSVYKWLDQLEPLLPFPVYRITHGNLGDDSVVNRVSMTSGQIYTKTLLPLFIADAEGKKRKSMMLRRCTSDYKVKIICRFLKKKFKPPPPRKQFEPIIIQWFGISTDEAHRMKPSQLPWIKHEWPLINLNMSRQDCIQWLQAKGYPIPPKSACIFCPYHNDKEWLRLKTEEPAEFQKAVQYEKALQEAHTHQTGTARLKGKAYLHRSVVPLDQINFDTSKDEPDYFGNECAGVCNT